MPQWTRNPAQPSKYPDERWTATCPRADAPLLLRHDHHVVWIGGRRALLLTYPWSIEGLEAQPDPPQFDVSFTYPAGHPSAPAEVQAIVDELQFTKRAQP